MKWFGNRRPTTADALELELAGTATGSAAAELVPLAEALQRAATSLPPPTELRDRREELVAVGTAAAAADARRRRVIRPMLLAAVLAILLAAAALGAALVSSWLQSDPRLPAGHAPTVLASTSREDTASPLGDGSDRDGADEMQHYSPPSPEAQRRIGEDADCGVAGPALCAQDAAQPAATASPPTAVDQLTADLLALLMAACGEDVGLLELGGLDAPTATALVEALVAECEAALEASMPTESPVNELDELAAELLAMVIAACGEDATLPDLTGLDDATATALVEALVAECEAALEPSMPTESPVNELDELAAELLAMVIAACGEDATLPDLTGLDDATATALVEALVAECEAALTLP